MRSDGGEQHDFGVRDALVLGLLVAVAFVVLVVLLVAGFGGS